MVSHIPPRLFSIKWFPPKYPLSSIRAQSETSRFGDRSYSPCVPTRLGRSTDEGLKFDRFSIFSGEMGRCMPLSQQGFISRSRSIRTYALNRQIWLLGFANPRRAAAPCTIRLTDNSPVLLRKFKWASNSPRPTQ